MTTAGAVAVELRRIADVFEKDPAAEVNKPTLDFYHYGSGDKDRFLSLARIFPRPFEKGDGFSHDQYTLKHDAYGLKVYASIDRRHICKLVTPAQPATFECDPLLSEAEEESVQS